jgi:CO/xanthine dehydrogenase FAD-binding subunit
MRMDLNTVTEVVGARDRDAWRPGDAWLAGGTYLFSQPNRQLRRLVDLNDLGWPPLRVTDAGLEIAATCTIAELARYAPSEEWVACRHLIRQCCEAFLASFKIWHVATVGGNLCTALPAGPMISLSAALDGICTLIGPDGSRRGLPVAEFVTGAGRTALADGELLRSITLPAGALRDTTAFRQASLHRHGRSAALLIGRRGTVQGTMHLTVTASTARPVLLSFAQPSSAAGLRAALEDAIRPDAYFGDIHGLPVWRRHMTLTLAEEIRRELDTGVD